MNGTTLSRIQELFSGMVELLSKTNGVGFWVFMAGFIILLIVIAAIVIKLLVSLIKLIPSLTVGQFIKLLIAFALVLIVVGIFLP